MLLRVQEPPEFLGEVGGILATRFQIVEVFRRDALQDLAHPAHREWRQIVPDSAAIQLLAEEPHQFPALGYLHFHLRTLQMRSDMLHARIVHLLAKEILSTMPPSVLRIRLISCGRSDRRYWRSRAGDVGPSVFSGGPLSFGML